jgi:hypothetical protein
MLLSSRDCFGVHFSQVYPIIAVVFKLLLCGITVLTLVHPRTREWLSARSSARIGLMTPRPLVR